MRVKHVQPGDLIKPFENFCWDVLDFKDPRVVDKVEDVGKEELEEAGVTHEILVMRNDSWKQGFRTGSVAVYVGVMTTSTKYRGVKTHHIILLDGMRCMLDGYQFAYLNKV